MYLGFNEEVVEPPLSGPSEPMDNGPIDPSIFCLIRNKGKNNQMYFYYDWPSKVYTYIPTPLAEQWRTGDAEHSRP